MFCLSKIVINFFTEEPPKKDENNNLDLNSLKINQKLKSCLATFIKEFINKSKKNLNDIRKIFVPSLKFAINKNSASLSKKSISKFFYFLTCKIVRQSIVSDILDEALKHSNDFKLVHNWIEILLEFNIHQTDIDTEANVDNMRSIVDKINKLIVSIKIVYLNYIKSLNGASKISIKLKNNFKFEKWKIPREEDLKTFASSIKSLITQNTNPTKRKMNNSIDKENETEIEKTPKQNAGNSQHTNKRPKY